MWFTNENFSNIPELWPFWGLVNINHSSILWWFRCLLAFWNIMKPERLLQLSTPCVDGDEDELMISKKPRKNAHHYSSSFLYIYLVMCFVLIFPDTAMAPTYKTTTKHGWCMLMSIIIATFWEQTWPILSKVCKPFSNSRPFRQWPKKWPGLCEATALELFVGGLESWCKIHLQNNWGVQIWVFP